MFRLGKRMQYWFKESHQWSPLSLKNALILKKKGENFVARVKKRIMNQMHELIRFFRSRKKFSTTFAIVLFIQESEKIFDYLCNRAVFLFFFSRPFHENFKFLKNCPYDFHEILHSHSTPKGAPACAMASKSYGWDVRNIAKISPKMAKKHSFFDFFLFSQKLSIRFEWNFVQSFYTMLWSFVCNFINFVLLGCEKHSLN